MKQWAIRKIKLNRLNAAKYNPRRISAKALSDLSASLDEFGVVQPIVWNERTGNVVGGHQRVKIMAARGEIEAECVVVDLTPEQEKALNLALNNPNAQGTFAGSLQDILEDLAATMPELVARLNLNSLQIERNEAVKIVEHPIPPAPPRCGWVLLCVPLESFVELTPLLEAAEKIPGVLLETTVTNEKK